MGFIRAWGFLHSTCSQRCFRHELLDVCLHRYVCNFWLRRENTHDFVPCPTCLAANALSPCAKTPLPYTHVSCLHARATPYTNYYDCNCTHDASMFISHAQHAATQKRYNDTHTNTHTHTHAHTHIHAYTHARTRARTRTHAHTHTYIHTHADTRMRTHIYIHTHTHTHTYTHTHTHTHTHNHVHLHAHTHTRAHTQYSRIRMHVHTHTHTHTHTHARTHARVTQKCVTWREGINQGNLFCDASVLWGGG